MNKANLTDFFRTGKVETDFEIREDYVIGVCTLYPDRMAGSEEHIVREKSVVEADDPLSDCAQKAKDLAFRSAIERLEGISSPATLPKASSTVEPKKEQESPQPTLPATQANTESPTQEPDPSKPRRLDFANLRPASSLIAASPTPEPAPAPELDADEQRIEKARTMPITILGKLHDCNGWTAGRILDERPEIIVEMVKRYNGPKVEEKEALRTLYNEALLRIGQAA